MIRLIFLIAALETVFGCKNVEAALLKPDNYSTKNVVVVVIDGPRYSETWGDPKHKLVPRLATYFRKEGIINSAFYNTGPTYTNAGHAAITTGIYQEINNGGKELPKAPSFFQYWLKATGNPTQKAWIVTSKDKLNILSDCKEKVYRGKHLPKTECGISGPESGYREDSVTYRIAKQVIKNQKPNLMLINFREPDSRGHSNDWEGYLKGIKQADELVWQLWQFLQNDPDYRNKTTLIVTNDHGRHNDGHGAGFISHGDNCDGCRHINFYAAGPDFKKNTIINTTYNQTDIPATIAELMGFKMPKIEGKVMWELFEGK